ncbi:MAG: DUF1569 domain-containing protein [Aureispira sp.]
MTLSILVEKLETYVPAYQEKNPAVSSTTVGWQVAHSLQVMHKVIHGLELSKPEEYRYKFNFIKSVILAIKRIPRGKGRAPKAVAPEATELTLEILQEQVVMTKKALVTFSKLPKQAFFIHPVFGALQKKETEKFLKIHTQHHLAIIRDMLQKK